MEISIQYLILKKNIIIYLIVKIKIMTQFLKEKLLRKVLKLMQVLVFYR
jgi:hypothetical protein